jgi:hypothetical protein
MDLTGDEALFENLTVSDGDVAAPGNPSSKSPGANTDMDG